MRTMGPLVVGIIAGWIGFGDLYIPNESYRWLYDLFRDFAQILTAVAFILGGLNLIQVNYPKIKRREIDWQYKILMLVSALVVGLTGIEWHTFGGVRDSGSATLTAAPDVPAGTLRIKVEATHKPALVLIGGKAQRAWHAGDPEDVWSSPGDQSLDIALDKRISGVTVTMPVSGYTSFTAELVKELPLSDSLPAGVFDAVRSHYGRAAEAAKAKGKADDLLVFSGLAKSMVAHDGLRKAADATGAYFLATEAYPNGSGAVLTIKTDLVMRWGAGSPEGRVFSWFYDYVFVPCNATMFALLAFFIASAAFRAFRARNVESAMLLGAAILVMIGIVPFGRLISPFFPELADWILDYPNNAGRRAIMMGAALGAIVTGLRVILGLERSHLGSDN